MEPLSDRHFLISVDVFLLDIFLRICFRLCDCGDEGSSLENASIERKVRHNGSASAALRP